MFVLIKCSSARNEAHSLVVKKQSRINTCSLKIIMRYLDHLDACQVDKLQLELTYMFVNSKSTRCSISQAKIDLRQN